MSEFNRLYAIDTYVCHTTLSLSLAMSCASRKGGTGGGGQISTLGPGNMAASGLSCRKLLVSTGWAISISLLLCMNGLRKQSSGLVGPPFPAVKIFSRSVGATVGQEPWLLQAC